MVMCFFYDVCPGSGSSQHEPCACLQFPFDTLRHRELLPLHTWLLSKLGYTCVGTVSCTCRGLTDKVCEEDFVLIGETLEKIGNIRSLQKDPEQQELRINLRTRFGLGPYKDSFWSWTLKRAKSNGFIDLVQKSIKKALVLQNHSKKTLKKQWFYRSGNRNC